MIDRSITFSSACIKLQKRHLLEWEDLVAHQQIVLKLVKEKIPPKPPTASNDKRIWIDLTRSQTTRILNLLARQREDREQLKARHRQEKVILKQVLSTT